MPLVELKSSSASTGGEKLKNEIDKLAVDIIAVHGLNEDLKEAWTDPTTRILWLRDLLPESLNVARVLTFGYNADVAAFYGGASADTIQQHAHTLVADLQANRQLEACSHRPIIFVCHGLGGILVKKAISYSSTRTSRNVDHLYSIFSSTYAILFFGTPHYGADEASWISLALSTSSNHAALQYDCQIVSVFKKDSETLQAITEHFSSLMKQFHVFFFWEEIKTELGQREVYLVEESSAAPLLDNTERAGVNANHHEMVKFSDPRTSSYRTVIEALIRYCHNAPAIIAHRRQIAVDMLARARSNEAFELAGIAFDVHQNSQPFNFPCRHSEQPKNKYFRIPQVVSNVFTGREDVSATVERCFWGPDSHANVGQQRRYIIHGIGGSGKTQFCSKFAQDHRERFWGIFWIDATSAETARHSYSEIGKLGGMEATQNAGKYWLSESVESWLLIINNADNPNLDLHSLFPEGDRGNVMVNTRNPHFRIHATAGSTELTGLKDDEALSLLLRTANIPQPWPPAIEEMANKIANALGHLALALVHAGTLIFQRLCDLQDYLDVYKKYRGKLSSESGKMCSDEHHCSIYATFEHTVDMLELQQTESGRDAIQLLSIIAFFHFQHIRVDIFTKAIKNRLKTAEHSSKVSYRTRVADSILTRLQSPPILPNFLITKLDPYRIRRALHKLRSFSLINYDGKDDSFSLHPLVHAWARDRLSTGKQALWAQMALNVLAESVQLPPKDVDDIHETFRNDILIHLDLCIRSSPIHIDTLNVDLLGRASCYAASILQPTRLFTMRSQIVTAARCGYVYYNRGRFNEAADLLSKVREALVTTKGRQDAATRRATLGLTATYWGLGRLEEAIVLQKSVLLTTKNLLGPDHAETLNAMNELGRSFWLNGQYHEALDLQTLTLNRSKTAKGLDDELTLTAMDNLGVTLGSWQRFRESRDMHNQVLEVRQKRLGIDDLKTLETMNNLAMALQDLGQYAEARKYMEQVYEQRKKKMGKEHPYTLWALCNMAKVYTELKLLKEAEDIMIPGLAAAKRSIGEDHLGTLMGKAVLARIYVRQGRLDEALALTLHLVERSEHVRGPGHYDTLYALFMLARCYERRNEIDRAIEACVRADERTEIKLTKDHPFARDVSSKLAQLKRIKGEVSIPTPKVNARQSLQSENAKKSIMMAFGSVTSKQLQARRTF